MSMQPHLVRLPSGQGHWYDAGGAGPWLHFYHANSFPFGVYDEFVQELASAVHVFGLAHRATWTHIGPPAARTRWMAYADDLIAFLDAQGHGPVIGAGHSLGATATLFAAGKRPDLFRALVLLEPVFFPTRLALTGALLPQAIHRLLPIVRKTLHRPDRWRSHEEFIAFHRTKRAFARFTPGSLHAYARHGLTPDPEHGYRLAFPKLWEAHIYSTVPLIWRRLRSVRVPILGLRGALSDLLGEGSWAKWRRLRPQDRLEVLPGVGHLAPMEAPQATAHAVLAWLQNKNRG
jgi:pimeloyl-ACP methyl ester carboxylesterase